MIEKRSGRCDINSIQPSAPFTQMEGRPESRLSTFSENPHFTYFNHAGPDSRVVDLIGDNGMMEKTVSSTVITQVADQLRDLVNELMGVAGERASEPLDRLAPEPAFRAELRRFHANGEFVELSDVEARILEALLDNRGQLVTKAQLCDVLELDLSVQERNLKSYVYRLKTKLNKLSDSGVVIRPIHGAGYVLYGASDERRALAV